MKKIHTHLCHSSQEEVQRVDSLSEEIGTTQSLRNSFNPILSIIVIALDAPAIFMRTKALKALGQIVTSDATILSNVRFQPFFDFTVLIIFVYSPMSDVELRAIYLIVPQPFVMLPWN